MIVPGDRLVRVNNATDTNGMLHECRNAALVKLFWERGSAMRLEALDIVVVVIL